MVSIAQAAGALMGVPSGKDQSRAPNAGNPAFFFYDKNPAIWGNDYFGPTPVAPFFNAPPTIAPNAPAMMPTPQARPDTGKVSIPTSRPAVPAARAPAARAAPGSRAVPAAAPSGNSAFGAYSGPAANYGPGTAMGAAQYGGSNYGGTPSGPGTAGAMGFGGGGGGGGKSVLCLHYAQLGWMPWETYELLRSRFTYPHEVRVGYMTWAIPTVVWFRRGTWFGRAVERCLWPFVRAYAKSPVARAAFVAGAGWLGRVLLWLDPSRDFKPALDREFPGFDLTPPHADPSEAEPREALTLVAGSYETCPQC